MNTLARYLSDVRKIRSLGSVPETSYYPPLSELLNTIGMSLSPKVRCVVHPKSQGAGIPDLALFSVDQIPADGVPLAGAIPSRGVIEAKGTGESVDKIAASKQITNYLEHYGKMLVTNLRDFAGHERGHQRASRILESGGLRALCVCGVSQVTIS